jgi:flavin-dependent dehydrogenase
MTGTRLVETEIAVVGGGPVGLATAIFARRRGLEVTVFDRRRPPIDKACGEGLMPDGVELLEEMGIDVGSLPAVPFSGIRYLDREESAEGRFSKRPGLGLRRTVLHSALAEKARQCGVHLRWGVRVEGLEDGVVASSKGLVRARWIVGADGLHSRVREMSGLKVHVGRRRRYGVRRHYSVAPWSRLVEVYWADSCEAYVTPVDEGEVGVALLWSAGKARFDDLLKRFPRLAQRLESAESSSSDRGAGPLAQHPERVHRGNVALVGDAAGYLDAITGEGLALGFHQARAVVQAIQDGRLESYQREFDRLVAWPFALIRCLLFAERHPRLRRRLIRALGRDPELFSRLLSAHAGEIRPQQLGVGTVSRLLLGIAAA